MDIFFEWPIKIVTCLVLGFITFIPIIIAARRKKKQTPMPRHKDSYVMQPSPKVFWIGIGGAVVGYLFSVMMIAVFDDMDVLYGLVVFMGLALMGTYLVIYFFLWRAIVEVDTLTIYLPLLPNRTIKLYEITSVSQIVDNFIVYVNKNRFCIIDTNSIGFHLFYDQLYRAGIVGYAEIKESFSVTESNESIIRNILMALLFNTLGLMIIFCLDERMELIYYILYICFIIMSLQALIHSIVWRITVSYNTINIRNMFGRVKSYSIREVKIIQQDKEHIEIFTDDKKIAMVTSDCKNYSLLLEWFKYNEKKFINCI